MSTKPIFVATHPRACSTAFERVFMTRHDTLSCVHEPFGDAFYYGPERLSPRFEEDVKARTDSGFHGSTYKTIFDLMDEQGRREGKRLFIKDIIHYLVPPKRQPASIAPSLLRVKRGVGTDAESKQHVNGVNGVNGTNGTPARPPYPFDTDPEHENPTVVPANMLDKFHFVFLIRDPHSSIPSYYRCTIPPLDKLTGFYDFYPAEAGYDEVRRVFEYLRKVGHVGPHHCNDTNGSVNGGVTNGAGKKGADICVVDADDLLDHPESVLQVFCKSVDLEYTPDMLNWDNEEDQMRAKQAFEKWPGFHEDAIDSTDLKPRTHKKEPKSEEQWDAEWKEKYGAKAAKVIRQTVDDNMEDYLYMKQFTLTP